jgi:hypothetical protein
MNFKDYSELTQHIEEHDDTVECILGCENYSVVKINNEYWYYEHPVEDASDIFYEVTPIATAQYTVVQVPNYKMLYKAFECDVCGEDIRGHDVFYWWFIKKGACRNEQIH